jgi:hypothetical protein
LALPQELAGFTLRAGAASSSGRTHPEELLEMRLSIGLVLAVVDVILAIIAGPRQGG